MYETIPTEKQIEIENIRETDLLTHQKSAGVWRMAITTLIIMFPCITLGCFNAFFTVCIPQFLVENDSGVILNIFEVSWLSKYN